MKAEIYDPKFIIAYTIILGFAAAYIHKPDDTMNGALIAAFAGAWGFYLGSSNSAGAARDQVSQALDIAAASTPAPPDPNNPYPVMVVNAPTEPVSDEAKGVKP